MNVARRGRRRGRSPLSRGEIVAASVALVEAEGLGALTMRRVADELGVAPMSIYRHVEDRRGLLLAMLDQVALGISPDEAVTPRGELAGILDALHQAFLAHPWVVPVLAADGLASRNILPLMDRAFGALFAAGLGVVEAARAWQVLFQFVAGQALFSAPREEEAYSRGLVRSMDAGELPSLARLAEVMDREEAEADFHANLSRLVELVLPDPV